MCNSSSQLSVCIREGRVLQQLDMRDPRGGQEEDVWNSNNSRRGSKKLVKLLEVTCLWFPTHFLREICFLLPFFTQKISIFLCLFPKNSS